MSHEGLARRPEGESQLSLIISEGMNRSLQSEEVEEAWWLKSRLFRYNAPKKSTLSEINAFLFQI